MGNAAWGHGLHKGLDQGRAEGAIGMAAATLILGVVAWAGDAIVKRAKTSRAIKSQGQNDPLRGEGADSTEGSSL